MHKIHTIHIPKSANSDIFRNWPNGGDCRYSTKYMDCIDTMHNMDRRGECGKTIKSLNLSNPPSSRSKIVKKHFIPLVNADKLCFLIRITKKHYTPIYKSFVLCMSQFMSSIFVRRSSSFFLHVDGSLCHFLTRFLKKHLFSLTIPNLDFLTQKAKKRISILHESFGSFMGHFMSQLFSTRFAKKRILTNWIS